MADLTSAGVDWNEIITYVGAAVGAGIGALALRMGWKSGGKELAVPSDSVEIKTAIIDSSSIKMLAAAVEGLGFNLLELKKIQADRSEENEKQMDRLIDAIENQTTELRELSREIRDHAREVSKAK